MNVRMKCPGVILNDHPEKHLVFACDFIGICLGGFHHRRLAKIGILRPPLPRVSGIVQKLLPPSPRTSGKKGNFKKLNQNLDKKGPFKNDVTGGRGRGVSQIGDKW